jgi:hypothetical protein
VEPIGSFFNGSPNVGLVVAVGIVQRAVAQGTDAMKLSVAVPNGPPNAECDHWFVPFPVCCPFVDTAREVLRLPFAITG